ncbi:unnamed protein product, partial [Fusarium langsethiae]
ESAVNNMCSQPAFQGSLADIDSWRAIPSRPGETPSADSSTSPIWAPRTLTDLSPTPVFTQPHSTAGFFWSSPQVTASIHASQSFNSMLDLAQCGIGMGMGGIDGMSGSGWNQYRENAANM